MLVLLFLTSVANSVDAHSGDGFHQSLVHGCSSHCQLNDKSLKCWNATLGYFENILMGQMRHYTVTQAHRAIWSQKKGRAVDYDRMVDDTVVRMLGDAPPDIEDEDGITDRSTYQRVVTALVKNAKQLAEALTRPNGDPPHVGPCPVPCEHAWDPYFWLFLGSCCLSVSLTAVILLLVWLLDRRDTKLFALELKEDNSVVKLPLSKRGSSFSSKSTKQT